MRADRHVRLGVKGIHDAHGIPTTGRPTALADGSQNLGGERHFVSAPLAVLPLRHRTVLARASTRSEIGECLPTRQVVPDFPWLE